MSLASGGFVPKPPPGLRPWTPLGGDPLFRIPFMKILDPPLPRSICNWSEILGRTCMSVSSSATSGCPTVYRLQSAAYSDSDFFHLLLGSRLFVKLIGFTYPTACSRIQRCGYVM